MACSPEEVITSAELTGLKQDIVTIDAVVESSLDTTTTKSGKVINTLEGQLKLLGYEPPVVYAGGISFTTNDNTKTIDESGVVYAPLPSALPFTTSGTFIGDDDARFFVIQGITTDSKQAVKPFATLTSALASATIVEGDAINIAEENQNGGMWDVVLLSSVIVNGRTVFACTSVVTLALKLRHIEKATGIKVTRSNNKKHYGWGSTAVLPDGRWMQVFRAGAVHATENNAQLMVHYSDDEGSSWYGEKEIYRNALSDSRPDGLKVMANGRIGCVLNRKDNPAVTHYNPLFVYTDDNGANWSTVTIVTAPGYTFSSVGGMIDYPASQGGDDTLGFVCFGFASGGQMDAVHTVDNGATWAVTNEINTLGAGYVGLSEAAYARIGTSDRWLIYARATDSGGWAEHSAVFATTNLLSWGAPISSNVVNRGTPPACVYDEVTGNIDLYVVARGGKDIADYDNALLVSSENAETLWAANGVHTGYPARVAEVPNWFTGYLYPFKNGVKNYFTMMFGENPYFGDPSSTSAVAVLSDAPTSSKDAATISILMTRFVDVQSLSVATTLDAPFIDMTAPTNVITEHTIDIENLSGTVLTSYGPYEDRHNMAGTDYLTHISDNYNLYVGGDLYLDSSNVLIGTGADAEGLDASMHARVASSSSPALMTHALGTTSSRKHLVFANANGEGGSIALSGTTTAYNTSSDPRLKTDLKPVAYEEAKGVINNLYDCAGKFQFNGDLTTDVVGFNAHKVLDIVGLGSEVGTEGQGSRALELGEMDGETKVTPAGVDQSKVVPYLVILVKELMDKVEVLEAKVEDLEG